MAGDSDKNKYGDQKGLTLIEIMVGLLVIGISILAMYIMFINGREMITEQYHRRIALEKARALMEDMQYSSRKLGSVPTSFRGAEEDTLVAGEGRDPIFAERTVTVEHSPQIDIRTGYPYYSEVSVVYEWEELSGREYRVELRSAF
ncbi:MAG: prepilin-type N-terminal cleavage/methylation domain-containing protein [Candidatus Zixiibacteriota bacterium]|nr:MAG: prepilin-type N-terminal cleavage/methylation domain-containing protein [candidate division Zixibacteria bacterium]